MLCMLSWQKRGRLQSPTTTSTSVITHLNIVIKSFCDNQGSTWIPGQSTATSLEMNMNMSQKQLNGVPRAKVAISAF